MDRDTVEAVERSRAIAGLGKAGINRGGIRSVERSRAMAGLGNAAQGKAQNTARKEQ